MVIQNIIGPNLFLGEMNKDEVLKLSDLVEKGLLTNIGIGTRHQILLSGDYAIKCAYDRVKGNNRLDASHLMREAIVQNELPLNDINAPLFKGYCSGNEDKRAILILDVENIKPAIGTKAMFGYFDIMSKVNALGYKTTDTTFKVNHGVDGKGKNMVFDMGGYWHKCWRKAA